MGFHPCDRAVQSHANKGLRPSGWTRQCEPSCHNMEKLLKEWRQDAMHKHQYESAIYIGDKLLALTGMPSKYEIPHHANMLIRGRQ